MKNNNFLKVYISALPSVYEGKALYPKERQNEIERTKNPEQKKQKYFAWQLLQYAFSKEFGNEFESVDFSLDPSGKWLCDICEFSISHCDNFVAVAISDQPVGIDIEKISKPKASTFAGRTLNKKELAEYTLLSDAERTGFLIKKWTQKEAIFKALNSDSFIPVKIDTEDFAVFSKEILFNDLYYFISVFSQNSMIPIFEEISSVNLV